MRSILVAIVLVILMIYIRYYYTYPDDVLINQTNLGRFSFDQLLEKHPLVIHDPVVDARELCKQWFLFSKCRYVPNDAEWIRNRYKHLLVHASADTEVFLAHPKQKIMADGTPDPNEQLLGISLKQHTVLVVPLHWRVHIAKPDDAAMLGIHDLITWMLP